MKIQFLIIAIAVIFISCNKKEDIDSIFSTSIPSKSKDIIEKEQRIDRFIEMELDKDEIKKNYMKPIKFFTILN